MRVHLGRYTHGYLTEHQANIYDLAFYIGLAVTVVGAGAISIVTSYKPEWAKLPPRAPGSDPFGDQRSSPQHNRDGINFRLAPFIVMPAKAGIPSEPRPRRYESFPRYRA